ncbi:hypothetical protein T459_25327 [Capsicum annuum]|uniref:Pentatricopeptide repeat-containing protein n=1 Tax=Capsicum annuum TaxID=4072 RepID=A0A2G2YKF9_CAPAN|nr:hypothetical protein T459_25327 [Capsicum annuum]
MSDQKMFLAVLSVVIGLDNVVTLANLVTLAMKMGYSEDVVETAILNAFTRVRNLDMALRYFGNLPTGYMRNGMVDKAKELFKQMTTRNVACWAAMIYGLMHIMVSVESLELMAQMHILGNIPSDSSLTSALLACANIGDVEVRGTDTFSFIQSRVLV